MPPRPALATGAVLGAAGYAWLAGGARSFTAPAGALQGLSYAAMALVAWRAMRRRRALHDSAVAVGASAGSARPAQMSAWALASLLIVCFELVMYLSQPRRSNPTISSLFDELAQAHFGRALAFFFWLLLGWVLVGR
jgi:hypothetical protein